jgi:hypothetical protein
MVIEDVGQVRDELGRGVAGGRLAQHFTSLGIERGIRRQRAVAVVLEAVSFGTSHGEPHLSQNAVAQGTTRLPLKRA